ENLVEHLSRPLLMRQLLGGGEGDDFWSIFGRYFPPAGSRPPSVCGYAQRDLEEKTLFRAGTYVVDTVGCSDERPLHVIINLSFRRARISQHPRYEIEIVIDHSSQASFSFARAHGTRDNDSRRVRRWQRMGYHTPIPHFSL